MVEPLKFSRRPRLKNPALIVGWSSDNDRLGTRVTDYLNGKLEGQSFCEIEPVEFFTLGRVAIEDDLVQFPESKFYACPGNDLIVFKSPPPRHEWYKFLNLIVDIAGQDYRVRELHIIGGMISPGAHSAPRELRGTFNSPELRKGLSEYGLAGEFNYESPPGQRPTLNSYLLWVAKERNIPGVTLWAPIPFYLASVDDPKAQKRVLEVFNQRFNLRIDLSDLDEEISRQNQIITEMRDSLPDIDESIKKLESNLGLSVQENQELAQETKRFFRERRG